MSKDKAPEFIIPHGRQSKSAKEARALLADVNEVTFPDTDSLYYIKNDLGDIDCVGDTVGRIEITNMDDEYVRVFVGINYPNRKNSARDECTYTGASKFLSKFRMKELCVAWLALNYPESLNIDKEYNNDD